jgi:hypothetical protein
LAARTPRGSFTPARLAPEVSPPVACVTHLFGGMRNKICKRISGRGVKAQQRFYFGAEMRRDVALREDSFAFRTRDVSEFVKQETDEIIH